MLKTVRKTSWRKTLLKGLYKTEDGSLALTAGILLRDLAYLQDLIGPESRLVRPSAVRDEIA